MRSACVLVAGACAVFCASMGGSCALAAEGSDLTEFERVSDAKAFGWRPVDNTRMTLTRECKVGRFALRLQPEPNAGQYRGIVFVGTLDLTGAGAKDKIVFHVKQNFSSGMRIQIWTERGNINRSFRLNPGRWTRVELDMDLSHWENPDGIRWGKVTRMQFYATSFSSEKHFMILDGLTASVGGKHVSPTKVERIGTWKFPHETPSSWRIGNADVAWAVSKATGQVVGGWNARTKECYLLSLEGRYHLEDRKSRVTAIASQDSVLSSKFLEGEQRIELSCFNPSVPDLTIRKRYWIRENKLFQQVAFTTRSGALQFITYNTQAIFDRAYRDAGYYMGGADGGGPLVPAPRISTWQKVTQYQNTAKGMVLHQPEKGYSFAHIRTRLDGKFVWPWFTGAIASYCERENVLHYTSDGWDMSLGTSKLSQTKETSYEQYVSVFEGDWQRFLRSEYASLPEVRQALREIPPVPEWVGDVKISAGSNIARLRRMAEMTDEGTIMSLVDFGGSWADYYVDKSLVGAFGGTINAEELKDLIRRIKALSPRIKVGTYFWMLSTTENSRIYRKHPEWFRSRNKDGEPITTFPGVASNYAHNLSMRACYDELLSQIDLAFSYLGTDFVYLDDPKAINMIDWESGEFTRDDLSFQFFLDVKRIAARHGPDKVVFFNNRGNPYGDINFIEARSTLRASYWRKFTGISAVIQEFISSTRPDSRIVPLYYVRPHEREYINHVLAMGWIPSLVYGNALARRAFTEAAYEIGNCATVPLLYSPDWKRDKKTNVESYAVQRRDDSGYLLSFISHEENTQAVPVKLDLGSVKLDRKGPVFVWEYLIEDANEYKGIVTAPLARSVYAKTGWKLDKVTRRKLAYAGPYRRKLALDVNMEPLLLYQLYITDQPAAVYSENNLPANYMLARKPKVKLTATTNWTGGSVDIKIDSSRAEAEIIVFVPLASYRLDRVSLDGQAVKPALVWEGGNVFPVIKVGRGQHVLSMAVTPTAAKDPIAVKDVTVVESPTGMHVRLPGFDEALLTVEKDGRVLYNRMATRENGDVVLPVASVRKYAGPYDVSLRAVVDRKGEVHLATSDPVAVGLSAAVPDLGFGYRKPAMMPGSREIVPVNREIMGLNVLRSGTQITATLVASLQPKIHGLMARADPDRLLLEAGTTRKIDIGARGAAFAGLEIKNLRRVKVRLSNTFHNAYHQRGPEFHIPNRPNSRNFAGMVVDYHTDKGYTKRVHLAVGVVHPKCSSTYPDYDRSALADHTLDLGSSLIEAPEKTFALDLQRYAPADWDGQVWLNVGSDWVASDRRLTLQILAANDAVSGPFLGGTDPKAYKIAYDKPKTLIAPRSPGGIVIDGSPDEEMWRGAAKTKQFFLQGGKGVSKANTSAMILYDDKNLYVAFVCMEPSRATPRIGGGAIWDDDEVEVWIDTNGDGKTYRQVIVNAANEKMEFWESGRNRIGAKTAVYVDKGTSWSVEMTIPFAGLGVKPPKPGDKWRLSLCRYRPPGRGFSKEQIVWAPLQAGGFRDLKNFGTLIFKK